MKLDRNWNTVLVAVSAPLLSIKIILRTVTVTENNHVGFI